MKWVQWPETEIKWICLENYVKSLQVNLFLAGFSYKEPLWAGLWPSAAFRSKSQVSLSRAILANVHNVAKFRFRTSDANDARYLTQRARACQERLASLHALVPRHYLDRAACTRACRRAGQSATIWSYSCFRFAFANQHFPGDVLSRYIVKEQKSTLGNASVLVSHPWRLKSHGWINYWSFLIK